MSHNYRHISSPYFGRKVALDEMIAKNRKKKKAATKPKPSRVVKPNIRRKTTAPSSSYQPKKKARRHNGIKAQIDYNSTHITTPDLGVIPNPFKRETIVYGKDIEYVKTFFGEIHDLIVRDILGVYDKYGCENVFILGCVAWLSDERILTVLARAAGVQIIVNDEDFRVWGDGNNKVVTYYDQLPKINVPFSILFAKCDNPLLKTMDPQPPKPSRRASRPTSILDPIVDLTGITGISSNKPNPYYYAPIRCIGTRPEDGDTYDTTNAPKKGRSSFQNGPILHSKYLIMCVWQGLRSTFTPIGVFTGSMNLTRNARGNKETVQWEVSKKIAADYLNDYVRAFEASKPIRR